MAANVIILSGVGQSRAAGIYRERNGRPNLTMQNLPLGSYCLYLFSLRGGRRIIAESSEFDGRYYSGDKPLQDPVLVAAVADLKGRVLAYGTAGGVLPSACELEAQIAERLRAEELRRYPTKLLAGEPQFFRTDEQVEVIGGATRDAASADTQEADNRPGGDYANVSPEDFLLSEVSDPLMKEDRQTLDTEALVTDRDYYAEESAPQKGEYMQERSERILGGADPERKLELARDGGRTVILQENSPLFERTAESPTYYETIRKEAEQLLRDYEHEFFLESFIEESSFVKIPFDQAGHYYVFGVVRESGSAKYLCFAVPEPYRETPPRTLRGFTQFVPRDPMRPYGDGYFMMFQSAVTGQTIPAHEST